MADTKYCLNWNSYENNICNGLAKLQQNEEFVDMTLVADGHLVKVHKNVLALASPYLKRIIQTAPCEHPVFFFGNLSHKTLCYILEYIYTGQTEVEVENLQAFLAAAEDLKLPGIVNFLPAISKNNENFMKNIEVPVETNNLIPNQCNLTINGDIKTHTLSINASNCIQRSNDPNNINGLIQITNSCSPVEIENVIDSEITEIQESNVLDNPVVFNSDNSEIIAQQYTVSNRGSLQLILNRYIYCNHHQALQGRKLRWRCIDYRLLHCQAYVDTFDENITERKNIHTHPYHDSKIMKKTKANLIFQSLSCAENAAKELNSFQNTNRIDEDR